MANAYFQNSVRFSDLPGIFRSFSDLPIFCSFSDLPTEILIQIYEEVIANNRTTRYIETNEAFTSATAFTPPGSAPDTSAADLRTLLQLHSASREVALRHISRNSGPLSQHLGLVVQHNFNPATDLISFGRSVGPWYLDGHSRRKMRSTLAVSLVVGAEFPNVVLSMRDFMEASPSPGQNPVTTAMEYLTNPYRTLLGGADPSYTDLLGRLEAPRMPRNLYVLIGPRRFPEPDEPAPQQSVFTLGEMTHEVLRSLPPGVLWHARHLLAYWNEWIQIPGLELPNLFFVCALSFDFDRWITEQKDGDYLPGREV